MGERRLCLTDSTVFCRDVISYLGLRDGEKEIVQWRHIIWGKYCLSEHKHGLIRKIGDCGKVMRFLCPLVLQLQHVTFVETLSYFSLHIYFHIEQTISMFPRSILSS